MLFKSSPILYNKRKVCFLRFMTRSAFMSNKRYDLILHYPPGAESTPQNTPPELNFVYTPSIPSTDFDPLQARLKYVTSAKYEQDWQSLVHTHVFCELFLVTGGRGQFFAKGLQFPVQKNDLVVINPLVEHTEFSLESSPLEYIVLGIEGLQFSQGDQPFNTPPFIHIAHNAGSITGKVRKYMELLLEEIHSKGSDHDSLCQNLLNIILILILRYKKIDLAITSAKNTSSECAAAKTYIDEHFKESITLEDLAGLLHQNKYYLAHSFKDAFGISPIRYLVERRIEESKRLLADTDHSIGEIASIAGFASASNFSQVFRRVTNTTPGEYRKNARSKKS